MVVWLTILNEGSARLENFDVIRCEDQDHATAVLMLSSKPYKRGWKFKRKGPGKWVSLGTWCDEDERWSTDSGYLGEAWKPYIEKAGLEW